MQATNMTNVISTVHNAVKPEEKNSSASEKEQFAVQLEQLMMQSKPQKGPSDESLEQLEDVLGDSEAEELFPTENIQTETTGTEEAFHPEAAALFQQPFIAAEEKLQFQGKAVEQAEMAVKEPLSVQRQNSNELGQHSQPTAGENKDALAMVNEELKKEAFSEAAVYQSEISFEKEKQETAFVKENRIPSFLGQPEDEVEQKASIASAKPPVSEPVQMKEKTVSSAREIDIVPAKLGEQQISEWNVSQETVIPELENQSKEMTDLDLQSDFRMKVALPKAEGSFKEAVTVQPTMAQAEPQVNVVLTSGKEVLNQQKLTQTVTDMMLQQVETTTVQQGQETTARVQITPESLGNITIEMRLADNQQLQTTIVVESAEVKEMLDKGMQQLTQSLAQKNIQLQEPVIQLKLLQPQEMNLGFAEGQSQQKQQQENNQPALYLENREEPVMQPVNEEADTPAGRVSILA